MTMHKFFRALRLNSANPVAARSSRAGQPCSGFETLESRTLLSAAVVDGVIPADTADTAIRLTPGKKSTAPRLTSAAAVDGSTVRVQFSRLVSRKEAGKLAFKIDGLAIK